MEDSMRMSVKQTGVFEKVYMRRIVLNSTR